MGPGCTSPKPHLGRGETSLLRRLELGGEHTPPEPFVPGVQESGQGSGAAVSKKEFMVSFLRLPVLQAAGLLPLTI